MPETNRQVLLARRPEGMIDEACFDVVDSPRPGLEAGEALVQIDYLSLDPTIRGWMAYDTYLPAIAIGEVIRSAAVGTVIESKSAGYPVGTIVFGLLGWQEYAVVGDRNPVQILPDGIDVLEAMSVYGSTGITAYFGLLDVGQPTEGDTVLVSGAAGATGSVVGQIAKIKGCRVIGIAGTEKKCDWLVRELGFDGAINYRTENVGARIGELCPAGVDVFFDNVGGEILEAALDHLALKARVVLCGSISTYNDREPRPGPRNLFNLTVQRARMEGFIVLDYLDRFAEAALQLAVWVSEGRIKYEIDLVEGGVGAATTAINRLFTGENFGKLVVKVTD